MILWFSVSFSNRFIYYTNFAQLQKGIIILKSCNKKIVQNIIVGLIYLFNFREFNSQYYQHKNKCLCIYFNFPLIFCYVFLCSTEVRRGAGKCQDQSASIFSGRIPGNDLQFITSGSAVTIYLLQIHCCQISSSFTLETAENLLVQQTALRHPK